MSSEAVCQSDVILATCVFMSKTVSFIIYAYMKYTAFLLKLNVKRWFLLQISHTIIILFKALNRSKKCCLKCKKEPGITDGNRKFKSILLRAEER